MDPGVPTGWRDTTEEEKKMAAPSNGGVITRTPHRIGNASTHVRVCLHPQGQVVNIPISNKRMCKETLVSQFPGATGLKYCVDGSWLAVPVENDKFSLPVDDHLFVVITDTVDRGRQILRSAGPIASEVSKMFNPRNAAAYSSDCRGNTLRKNARASTTTKKKQFSKAIKVLFISNVELPAPFSRSLVLSEGMFILNSYDDEMTIKNTLLDLLKKTLTTESVLFDDIVFLSFWDKKLSLPCVQETFQWNGDNLKANIGQGKLYVMVCSRSSQSYTGSHAEVQRSESTVPTAAMEDDNYLPDIPSSSDNQQVNSDIEWTDSGTPTIQFRRQRTRLSLRSLRQNDRQEENTNTSGLGEENRNTNTEPYRSYVHLFGNEVMCISDDSDNEEKTLATEDINQKRSKTLTENLVLLKSKLTLDHSCKFNINRNDVLDGARRAIKRKSFDPAYRMSVKFADDCGTSEGAIDEGGPTRELLRMLVRKIQYLSIFEGPVNARCLALNSTALSDGLYQDVGTLISMSIVHGGPAPKFFSKLLYESLVYGIHKMHIKPKIEDVSDADLKSQVEQLMKAEIKDIGETLDSMASLLVVSGCMRPIFNNEQKDKLLQDLLFFLVLGRTNEALSQLSLGLETLGVLQSMKDFPENFAELFTFSGNGKLTAEMLEAAFLDIKYSMVGSNNRLVEERIVGYWRDFLIDVEEDAESVITLRDVLIFATGADEVPPLGFDPLPSISFLHSSMEPFPKANTCGMVISLPVVQSYELFKKNMTFAIANSPGFGIA